MVNAASYYQVLGQNDKALEIVRSLSEIVLDDLAYYYYLYNKQQMAYIARQQYATDMRDARQMCRNLISIARKAGDTELSESIQKRLEMLRAEFQIPGNAAQQAPPSAP
jgi:tetratricopeptide (TPR) repeat protein